MKTIKINKYTLLKLEDNGKYGWKLMEGYENRDGKFKPSFCKRSFGKDGEEKTMPVSVKLGDKKQAREALSELLDMLCDDNKDDDSDVLF